MDRQKEPQVSPDQLREELKSARERIVAQAENLSIREYMKTHPYMTLGAAFFSGAVLGGSRELKENLAKAVVDIISNEVIDFKKAKK